MNCKWNTRAAAAAAAAVAIATATAATTTTTLKLHRLEKEAKECRQSEYQNAGQKEPKEPFAE